MSSKLSSPARAKPGGGVSSSATNCAGLACAGLILVLVLLCTYDAASKSSLSMSDADRIASSGTGKRTAPDGVAGSDLATHGADPLKLPRHGGCGSEPCSATMLIF